MSEALDKVFVCVVCLSEDTNELKNEVNEYAAREHSARERKYTQNKQTTQKRERKKELFGVRLASTCLDFFLP